VLVFHKALLNALLASLILTSCASPFERVDKPAPASHASTVSPSATPQNGQPESSSAGESATPAHDGSTTSKPQVTVNARRPHPEQPLPVLSPNEFVDCLKEVGADHRVDLIQDALCEATINWKKHIVIDACMNRDGKTALPRVIQACTELLDHNIIHDHWRFYIYANRADAYFAQDDTQRALDDYNAAVKMAPKNAGLHYNRGILFSARSDDEAALREFNTAIEINPKLVPALSKRAKALETRGNFSGALADYSAAIRLEPKTAALWSERGYVSLRQHDYESAKKDEAQAIQLDSKLARAYFLRGVAFGGLGDKGNALGDIRTAVSLDPSLAGYVATAGQTASLTLPPPP
jgi:Tfp pilus assembly protein PilF